MRALRLTAINQLELVEIPSAMAKPGEVLVAIRAAALNHRDVWMKLGQYAGLTFPCIPGSDGAGVVTAVGAEVDPAWVGREVIINPSLDWGGEERAQGNGFSILGLPHEGTFAETVTVPVGQLAAKPGHLSWPEAAALPLAGLTAWRAMVSRASVRASDRVLITGAGGGVAVFALQFAVAHGAEIWVTSSSAEKIARAVKLGAKGGVNYAQAEWAKDLGKAAGLFDVIVDSAGGGEFGSLLDLAAPGGRIVSYGATRGNPPLLPMRKIFWRQLSILGSTMGSPADWCAMVAYVSQHRLKPVVSTVLPLDRAGEAFTMMEQGGQFGKIVVSVNE